MSDTKDNSSGSGGAIGTVATVILGLVLSNHSGCGPKHGSKVEHGNWEVFYTEGVTKAEADRLGTYLVRQGGTLPNRGTVQLKKTSDGYQLRMVVKKEFQVLDEKTRKGLEV